MNENKTSPTELDQFMSLDSHSFSDEEQDQGVKYLTFTANGEVYGAEVNSIKEIIEYGIITRVPLTPKYLRGVINLRGNVVPVIDLAARLGKETNKISKRTCIIIMEMKSSDDEVMDIGFVVDEVDEVMNITNEQITAAPQFGTDIRTDFISGMVQIEEKFIIFLQLEEVLSVTELADLVEQESKEY